MSNQTSQIESELANEIRQNATIVDTLKTLNVGDIATFEDSKNATRSLVILFLITNNDKIIIVSEFQGQTAVALYIKESFTDISTPNQSLDLVNKTFTISTGDSDYTSFGYQVGGNTIV